MTLRTVGAAGQGVGGDGAPVAAPALQTDKAAEDARLLDLEASVIGLGSAELVGLVQAFLKTRLRFSLEVGNYRMAMDAGPGAHMADASTAMNAARDELRALFDQIGTRVRSELTEV